MEDPRLRGEKIHSIHGNEPPNAIDGHISQSGSWHKFQKVLLLSYGNSFRTINTFSRDFGKARNDTGEPLNGADKATSH
jgi:hypothetical protein